MHWLLVPCGTRYRERRQRARVGLQTLFRILALGFASACAQEPDNHLGIVERLIRVEGTPMPFEPSSLVHPTFTWSFQTPADLDPWEPGRSDWRLRAGRATLDSNETQPALTRPVDLEADTVDTMRVDIPGFRGSIELRWVGPSQTLEEPGVVATARRDQGPGSTRSVRFDLGDHPGWNGRIEKLRLTFKPDSEGPIMIRQVTGTMFRPEHLSDAASRPCKLELGSDVRNALLALPERPLELDLEVPRQAELRFSIGVPGTLQTPVKFRIVAVAGEGERQVLFEATPEVGNAKWGDRTLDLSHLAGQSLSIRFETEVAVQLTPTTGFPAWGNIEVIGDRPGPAPPNVVLISVDTLRADRLSLYGYHRLTSPNIDAWARRSAVVFERTVAPAPWTQPSHVSMFSGLDTLRHGVNDFDAAPAAMTMLPELLRQAGYATAAITAGGFMHPRFGLSQGFDTYFFSQQPYSNQELETGLDLSLSWLENHRKRPFFLFFHTYEVHSPFDARQPFFSRWSAHDPKFVVRPRSAKLEDDGKPTFTYSTQDDPEDVKPLPPELASLPSDLYDSAIAYTDHQLERLFSWLRTSGLEDNTIVVLTSDHGEMLGEHDTASHGYLYDENLLVPLIIASPGEQGAGTRVADQVRLIDLAPTVLELAGLPAPAGIDGASLLDLIEGRASRVRRPALSYAALRQRGLSLRLDNRLKYIRLMTAISPRHGQERVFNLEDDPREENNLVSADRLSDGMNTSPPIETLREQLRNAWTSSRSGARIRFENPGPLSFSGTFHGPPARPHNLKAFDLSCPCITREGGVTTFRMPPETSYSLDFESWNRDQRGLGLGMSDADGIWVGLQFEADTTAPQIAAYTDGTWQMIDPEQLPGGVLPDSVPRITLSWHGDQQLETASSQLENDPALVRDLEALGYL